MQKTGASDLDVKHRVGSGTSWDRPSSQFLMNGFVYFYWTERMPRRRFDQPRGRGALGNRRRSLHLERRDSNLDRNLSQMHGPLPGGRQTSPSEAQSDGGVLDWARRQAVHNRGDNGRRGMLAEQSTWPRGARSISLAGRSARRAT